MPINPLRYISQKIRLIISPPLLPKEKTSGAISGILNLLVKEKRPYILKGRIFHLNLHNLPAKKNNMHISLEKILKVWLKLNK